MDQHTYEIRRTGLAFVLLLVVVGVDSYGFAQSRSLSVASQLGDVAGDATAFLIVLFAAAISWVLDKLGREHSHNHPESIVAALVNLLILFIAVVWVTKRAVFELFNPRPPVDEWTVLAAPMIAAIAYWVINSYLKEGEDTTIAADSLRAHVKADVGSSAVVFFTTLLALIIQTSWINPVGGIVVSIIFIWLSGELIGKIRRHIRGNRGSL